NDHYPITTNEENTQLAICFGGRAAEELVYNEISSGAAQDIAQATKIATRMVTTFGMSDKIGPIALDKGEEEVFLGRDISKSSHLSEKMSEMIDSEIKSIIDSGLKTAVDILTKNRAILDSMVNYLLERETLNGEDIDKIVKGEPLEPLAKKESADNAVKDEPLQKESGEKPEIINGGMAGENV
ncbi:MAG: cell division protein FtsH, partial [Endomicrobium sp.]|nr:cell division protein FtsH [Endomicrobium sp.]